MIKFTNSNQLKLLTGSVIYYGIRVGDLEYKPYPHSNSHLKKLKIPRIRH